MSSKVERLQLQQYTTAKRNSIVDEPLQQAANVDNNSSNDDDGDSDEICATIESIDITSINTERRGYFLWFILQKGTKFLYVLFIQMQNHNQQINMVWSTHVMNAVTPMCKSLQILDFKSCHGCTEPCAAQ